MITERLIVSLGAALSFRIGIGNDVSNQPPVVFKFKSHGNQAADVLNTQQESVIDLNISVISEAARRRRWNLKSRSIAAFQEQNGPSSSSKASKFDEVQRLNIPCQDLCCNFGHR